MTGAVMAGLALLAGLAVEVTLDWLFELQWIFRFFAFVVTWGIVGFLAWRYIWIPHTRQPDDDTVALIIERAMPR